MSRLELIRALGSASVVALAFAVGSWGLVSAQEPTSTPAPTATAMPFPTPESTPAGQFTVTPSAGPVGSTVHLEGSFNQLIAVVGFQCGIGFVEAYRPPEPTQAISFEYTIPRQLFILQSGAAASTPIGECEFLAMPNRQPADLLARIIPFTVTAGLPTTGTSENAGGSKAEVAIGLAALGTALAAVSLALGLRGRRSRAR